MGEGSDRVPPMDPRRTKSVSERIAERMAPMKPLTWFLVKIGRHIDPVLMRLTNGRVNLTGTKAVVVLHHKGAKTGLPRQTPLAYFTDGDDVILVASSGGAPRAPSWYFNLRADPEIELWVGKRGGAYRARVATPAERAELWPKATQFYSGFAAYQQRAGDREIPLVICSPRPAN